MNFRIGIYSLMLGLFFSSAVKANAAVSELLPADSAKVKQKTTAAPNPVKATPQNVTKKKVDESPLSVDFTKKTVHFNLFGNTLDLDFKNKNMDVNKDKDKKPDDDWFNFF